MNCKYCENRLLLYLEGQLDEATHRRISDHLSGCEKCREKLEALQAVWSATAPEMPVPNGFIFQVHRRLELATRRKSPIVEIWKKLALPVLKPVAFILLLVSSTWVGQWLAKETPSNSTEQSASQAIEEYYPVEALDAQSETTLVGAYLAVVEQEQ